MYTDIYIGLGSVEAGWGTSLPHYTETSFLLPSIPSSIPWSVIRLVVFEINPLLLSGNV